MQGEVWEGAHRAAYAVGRPGAAPGLRAGAGARFGKGTRRGRAAEKQARSGRRAGSPLRWGWAGVAPGTGPIRVPGSARRPGEVRLGGGAGRPVRAPSRHSTDLLHIGFSAQPTGGGSRAEAMTSSQRPEVVECKKLPTCDQNKKERERKKTHSQNTLSRLLSVPLFYSSSS